MTTTSPAHAIASGLAAAGVRYLFGMPGGGRANRDPPGTGEIVTRSQIAQPEASLDHP